MNDRGTGVPFFASRWAICLILTVTRAHTLHHLA
jgi:hypothetical protein